MHKLRQRGGPLIPAWEMPSDPVRAVVWFFHWSLKLLARFFLILVLGAAIAEFILNGLVGGAITLLVGLGLWLGILLLLAIFNFSTRVSETVSSLNQLRDEFSQQSFSTLTRQERAMEKEGRVVEGSVTDLEEERRKRRPE